MHRDLKAETTIPPAANRSAQQRRFNEFRTYFNEVRPHESLDEATPASAYEPSPRAMPAKLSTPEYPAHFELRKVSINGGIRWNRAWINVSHLLGAEYIGLEEIADDVWTVFFGPAFTSCHPSWFPLIDEISWSRSGHNPAVGYIGGWSRCTTRLASACTCTHHRGNTSHRTFT